MSEFDLKLKTLRKEKDLSRVELGKVLGVTDSAIAMYERGKRIPNLEILRKIVRYFGIDFNYLLDPAIEVRSYANRQIHAENWKKMDGFLYENPEYYPLLETAIRVKKDEIGFMKKMIEKMT